MDRPLTIEARIAPDVADAMRDAIAEAGGGEVFFLGAIAEDGVLREVEVLARGTADAVPVVPRRVEPGAVMIHNHPTGPVAPSDADLAVAARYAQAGVGHYIVDNDLSRLFVVLEPEAPERRVEIAPLEVAEMLGPEGPIAQALAGYETRAGQIEMAEAVSEAFNRGAVALVEAGTGIGKSLAYLIPSLLWARANGERVVVSTRTINLQEQLFGKDLPLLARALPFEVRSALLKGRANYVCLRKLHALGQETRALPGTEDALAKEVADLVAWSETSDDGSLSDLPAPPSEEVWERVQSETDTCLRLKCPFFQRCFFYKSRRRAAAADVVVANHSLLFSDLAVRQEMGSYKAPGVLPPFRAVVLDEAHHLEEVATQHFGRRVTRRGLLRLLSRLHHEGGKTRKGVFPYLQVQLLTAARRADPALVERLDRALTEALIPAKQALGGRVEEFSQVIVELVQALRREGEGAPGGGGQLRLSTMVRDSAFFRGEVLPSASALVAEVREFREAVKAFREELATLPRESGEFVDSLVELAAIVGRLEVAAEGLHAALLEDRDDVVSFVEADSRTRRVVVSAAPLEVGPRMREALFEPIRTVVLTSATLSVDGDFHYIGERLGLAGARNLEILERLVPSPFDYDRQVQVLVPTDLPDPGSPAFAQALGPRILDAVEVTRGRAFVLFTSYSLLNRVHDALGPALRAAGLAPMLQGDGPRTLLLDRFRVDDTSVLFGADSFWEGVDVQGEALRLVILTRLPFRVPSEPVLEARAEAIAARGGSAFGEYALPQAILKLKQGFGRLIRSRTDTGIVVVLDKRLVTMRYGRQFLDALPDVPLEVV
ncbi:MAG: hypothetical protein KC466_06185 [Myxococcales bacterium]|nr:hypothetical protein [Myxococcales bacterium]